MRLLGWLPEWLAEGARATRLTSLFPFHNDIHYAPVPEAARSYAGLKKIRLESVRFAPLAAIQDLAEKKFDENRWVLDLASGCLQPVDRAGAGGPFRPLERQRTAVDRLSGAAVSATATGGIEFPGQAGAWALFVFANPETGAVWAGRLKAAFRLLADEGVGGWRMAGWGRSRRPRFREGELGRLLANAGWKTEVPANEGKWWMLGLYSPAESDEIAWDGGAYRTLTRTGWTAGSGAKPGQRFVREGSILASASEPAGRISESAMDGVSYGVLRYGAGLALPWREDG